MRPRVGSSPVRGVAREEVAPASPPFGGGRCPSIEVRSGCRAISAVAGAGVVSAVAGAGVVSAVAGAGVVLAVAGVEGRIGHTWWWDVSVLGWCWCAGTAELGGPHAETTPRRLGPGGVRRTPVGSVPRLTPGCGRGAGWFGVAGEHGVWWWRGIRWWRVDAWPDANCLPARGPIGNGVPDWGDPGREGCARPRLVGENAC